MFDEDAFKVWLNQCDKICIARIGLGIYDLEDWLWADHFEDGYTPEEAIDEFLEEIGAPV